MLDWYIKEYSLSFYAENGWTPVIDELIYYWLWDSGDFILWDNGDRMRQ